MTGREKLEAEDKKKRIYFQRGGRCKICGNPVPMSEAQLAHGIANTKPNIKKYGKEVIHHEKNLSLTCGNKFGRCNDACNIGNNPGKVLDLLEDISRGN